MAQGSGLTRGDRNRNRRIGALREVVRLERAVLAVDLGEDKQVAVLADHEGRVLARKVVKAKVPPDEVLPGAKRPRAPG